MKDSHKEMVVTWTTYSDMTAAIVKFKKYGAENVTTVVGPKPTEFVDNGKRTHYMHRVTLKDLEPRQEYCKWS